LELVDVFSSQAITAAPIYSFNSLFNEEKQSLIYLKSQRVGLRKHRSCFTFDILPGLVDVLQFKTDYKLSLILRTMSLSDFDLIIELVSKQLLD